MLHRKGFEGTFIYVRALLTRNVCLNLKIANNEVSKVKEREGQMSRDNEGNDISGNNPNNSRPKHQENV